MDRVVLIIDDDVFNRMALKALCKIHDVPALAVHSGKLALEQFYYLIATKQPIYKVILLDYSMPEMDGVETAKEIQKICKTARLDLPTIFCVTAYQHESYEVQAKKAGMKYFFTKPVTEK